MKRKIYCFFFILVQDFIKKYMDKCKEVYIKLLYKFKKQSINILKDIIVYSNMNYILFYIYH